MTGQHRYKSVLLKISFKFFLGGLPQKVGSYQWTVQTGAVSVLNMTVSRKKLIIYFCNNHTILSNLTIMTILTIQTPLSVCTVKAQYDDCIVHVKKCEQARAGQNLN